MLFIFCTIFEIWENLHNSYGFRSVLHSAKFLYSWRITLAKLYSFCQTWSWIGRGGRPTTSRWRWRSVWLMWWSQDFYQAVWAGFGCLSNLYLSLVSSLEKSGFGLISFLESGMLICLVRWLYRALNCFLLCWLKILVLECTTFPDECLEWKCGEERLFIYVVGICVDPIFYIIQLGFNEKPYSLISFFFSFYGKFCFGLPSLSKLS